MVYPIWPSRSSLEKVRTGIVDFVRNPENQTARLFSNISRVNPEIPFFCASIGNLRVFLKQDYSGLGRGSFEDEVQVSSEINRLRDICPNFNFSLVEISSDFRSTDSRTKGRILLTEYTPGPTFQEYLRSRPHFFDTFSLFLQTILAMEIAHWEIGLVHGDLLTSNIIVRELSQPMTVQYGPICLEVKQIPVIYDFDRSTLHKHDLRSDIYTLLFSSFRDYPKEFGILLKWYGVTFRTEIKHREIINEQGPRLKLHSGHELLQFGIRKFGFQPLQNGGPRCEPEDIPGV